MASRAADAPEHAHPPLAGRAAWVSLVGALVILALKGSAYLLTGSIGFLSDGLVIIGVSSYWQTVFTGAVIVLAVLLNSIQYRGRSAKR